MRLPNHQLWLDSGPRGPADDSAERFAVFLEATVADALQLRETYSDLHALSSDEVEAVATEYAEQFGAIDYDERPTLRGFLRAAAEDRECEA